MLSIAIGAASTCPSPQASCIPGFAAANCRSLQGPQQGSLQLCTLIWHCIPSRGVQLAQKKADWRAGVYVRVHGNVRGFEGKRTVVAFNVRPLLDLNEVRMLTCTDMQGFSGLIEVVHPASSSVVAVHTTCRESKDSLELGSLHLQSTHILDSSVCCMHFGSLWVDCVCR